MNLAIPALVIGLLLTACEKPKVSTGSNNTLDNNLAQSSRHYIHFELPARFTMDPSSHEGELKWWCKFDDPATGISVEASSYGYVNDLDLLMTVPGWNHQNFGEKLGEDGREPVEIIATDATHKNIESYFLSEIVPQGFEKKEFSFYDRYIHRESRVVTVFFFDRPSGQELFGQCYEWMKFSSESGTLTENEELIVQIIESARPWLSRNQSEQDGESDS